MCFVFSTFYVTKTKDWSWIRSKWQSESQFCEIYLCSCQKRMTRIGRKMANSYRCDIYMHSEYSFNAPSERTSSYLARGSRFTWCKLIQSETQFALSFLYWSTICPKYSVVKSHFLLKTQTNKVRFICSILMKKFEIRPWDKVHIFWEGHKILRNLHLTFDYSTYSQK